MTYKDLFYDTLNYNKKKFSSSHNKCEKNVHSYKETISKWLGFIEKHGKFNYCLFYEMTCKKLLITYWS